MGGGRWARARSGIALLADVGGAAVAVAAGVGLLVGVGVFLTDLLPTALLVITAIGLALVAFGLVIHLVGPHLRGVPSAPAPKPTEAPSDPFARARKLEVDYADVRLRKSARNIREELLDNREVLQKMRERKSLGSTFSTRPGTSGRRA